MPTELQAKVSVPEKKYTAENSLESFSVDQTSLEQDSSEQGSAGQSSSGRGSVRELIAKCDLLIEELRKSKESSPSSGKDWWDRFGSIAPIISGAIIALVGAHFTSVYNQQQLKLQEVQTVERFFPHLMGDERSKRAAILAISSLTDTRLAAKIASIYASEGTAAALEKIAQSENGGNRSVAQKALSRVLDNLAENYSGDKRFQDAENAFSRALKVKSEAYGEQSVELIPTLDKFAELCLEHGDYGQAGSLLKRSLTIKKQAFGNTSPEVGQTLHRLSMVYKREGNNSEAEAFLQEAHQIEGKEKSLIESSVSQGSVEPEVKKTGAGGANSEFSEPAKVIDELGSKAPVPVIELEPVSNTVSGAIPETSAAKSADVLPEHMLSETEKHVPAEKHLQ